jgi:hypothetical protein
LVVVAMCKYCVWISFLVLRTFDDYQPADAQEVFGTHMHKFVERDGR